MQIMFGKIWHCRCELVLVICWSEWSEDSGYNKILENIRFKIKLCWQWWMAFCERWQMQRQGRAQRESPKPRGKNSENKHLPFANDFFLRFLVDFHVNVKIFCLKMTMIYKWGQAQSLAIPQNLLLLLRAREPSQGIISGSSSQMFGRQQQC